MPEWLEFILVVLVVVAIVLGIVFGIAAIDTSVNKDTRACREAGYANRIYWNNIAYCIGVRDGVAVLMPVDEIEERIK